MEVYATWSSLAMSLVETGFVDVSESSG